MTSKRIARLAETEKYRNELAGIMNTQVDSDDRFLISELRAAWEREALLLEALERIKERQIGSVGSKVIADEALSKHKEMVKE